MLERENLKKQNNTDGKLKDLLYDLRHKESHNMT